MSFLDPLADGDLQGLPAATAGQETTTGELVGLGFEREALERNYWGMRQSRTRLAENAMIAEASRVVHGTEDGWRTNPEVEPDPGQNFFTADDWRELSDRNTANQDEQLVALFDALWEMKQVDPGRLANLPASLDEMRTRAERDALRELSEEYADVTSAIDNRTDPSLAGGVAEFIGMGGAAVSDVESVAVLPLGAVGRVGLAQRMVMEAFAGGAAEALTYPAYRDQAAALDLPAPNMWANVAAGTFIGGMLPAAVAGGRKALAFGRDKIGTTAPPELRAAKRELERDAATRAGVPEDVADGHVAAVDAAQEALQADKPITAVDLPYTTADELVTGKVSPDIEAEQIALNKGFLEFIQHAEGTHPADGRRGYNETLDYGRWTGGEVNLVDMTLQEVLALQKRMLSHPENRRLYGNGRYRGSSALGAYQIVRRTLMALMKDMGLSGSEKFTPALQDAMAIRLAEGRGRNASALKSEWQGLRRHGNAAVLAAWDTGKFEARGGSAVLGVGMNRSEVQRLPADDLLVDAKAYQYKLGGDEFGVTERLQGETVWDPEAGLGVMVHERSDGQMYVVDGHQRTGLARRLMSQGHDPIEVEAIVYREADGWTVEMVRTKAALTNIRNLTGTPLDAAKVLRDYPELADHISRTNDFMRQAQGLADLAPGPYQAIVNDVIPMNHAAIIGRIAPHDAEMQDVMIAALAKRPPENADQAEVMVRDIHRLGLDRRAEDAQGSLFGDGFDLGATALFERARVVDAAMKDLRRDRAVFNRLIEEADRIKGAGNVLKTTANETRAAQAKRALERLIILGEADGPVRDAIDSAAKRLQSGERIGTLTGDIIEAVTRAIDNDHAGRSARHADDDGPAAQDADGLNPSAFSADPDPGDGDALAPVDLFGDPTSPALMADAARRSEDLARRIEADPSRDIAVPDTDAKDAPARTVSEILQDHAEEAEFHDQLQICMRGTSRDTEKA